MRVILCGTGAQHTKFKDHHFVSVYMVPWEPPFTVSYFTAPGK